MICPLCQQEMIRTNPDIIKHLGFTDLCAKCELAHFQEDNTWMPSDGEVYTDEAFKRYCKLKVFW
jgi:hypothetical protein